MRPAYALGLLALLILATASLKWLPPNSQAPQITPLVAITPKASSTVEQKAAANPVRRPLVTQSETEKMTVAEVPASEVAPGPVALTAPAPIPPAASATAQEPSFAFEVELQVHAFVNAQREAAGLPALAYSPELAALARNHSRDMLEKEYFGHEAPDGCGLSCRFKAIGYAYSAIGENIHTMSGYELSAVETARHIVDGWMSSPGHRANIVHANFTAEGIGIVQSDDSLFATQNFAKPR
jgi:uncharacterized protein YkwD